MKSILRIILLCLGCFIFTFGQNKTEVYPLEKTPMDKEIEAQIPCNVDREEVWNILLKTGSQKEMISLLRIKCFKESGNLLAISKEVLIILEQNPNPSNFTRSEILTFLRNTESEIEIESLNFLINSNPNLPFVYYLRAGRQKNLRAALDDYLKSLALEKNFEYRLKSYYYLITDVIRGFLSLNKKDESIFEYYQIVFEKFQQKLREIEQISAKLNPQNPEFQTYEISKRNLRNSLQWLCMDWAKIYREMGNYEKENEILEKSLWIEPKWQAYYLRYTYYLRIGEFEKAKQDYFKFYEYQIVEWAKEIKQSKSIRFKAFRYKMIGENYVKLKRYNEAQVNYEIAKMLNPNFYIPKVIPTNIPTCVPGIPCPQQNPNKP